MSAQSAASSASFRFTEDPAVLVLDLHERVERLTESVLTALPRARVVEARGRTEFEEALRCERWSLVIVSLDLEWYSGTEAVREARHWSSAPVIAICTTPSTDDVISAMRDGAVDFIVRERLQDLAASAIRHLANPSRSSGAQPADTGFEQTIPCFADPHAMVLLDWQWIVSSCSKGVTAVLGYQPGELIGEPVEAFFTGIPEAPAFLLRLRAHEGPEPFRHSGWMLRRDGLRMWAEITCMSLAAHGSTHRLCLSVRDATLQYRASQSVRSQADAAAATTAARNLFLGSAAHELRAALAPIATSAILLERGVPGDAQQARLVAIIRRNAATAARLIEDLLTFSTAAEDKLHLRIEQVDLHRLLSAWTDAVRDQVTAAGVVLKLELEASHADALVQCDPHRVQQVVVNLLGNAIKFTPAGGAILVRTACEPEGFSIEVRDTGAGIDPSALPFIFDPFEQGGAHVGSRYGGFGLGLAICATVARQHGGKVVASSAGLGHGASFRFYLPRNLRERESPPQRGREPRALHVLYVEDNLDAADAMQYALRTLGWTMAHAATCASARELVHNSKDRFDVILADLGLPDGSGVELAVELSRDLPVVALTAYGAPLAGDGFVMQLIKPAEIGEIQRALLKAVAVRQRNAEIL